MDRVTETKLHFAKVFTDLRDNKSVEQIRIKDLCGNGGASRQTFYYHFVDKDDFLNWMMLYEADKAFKTIVGPFDKDGLENVLEKITSNDSFFYAIYGGEGASNNFQFLSDFLYEYEKKLVKSSLRTSELKNDQEFIVKYHSFALAGTIINIIKSSGVDKKELAKEIYDLMPPIIREAYIRKLDR